MIKIADKLFSKMKKDKSFHWRKNDCQEIGMILGDIIMKFKYSNMKGKSINASRRAVW